jgi:rubrerythrin
MPLVDVKDPKDIAAFLYCSSNLEERVFSLYRNMSERTDNQVTRSSFIYIAYDSLKHSVIMKGIAQTISPSAPKTEDCENKLKQVWTQVSALSEEMTDKNKLMDTDLPDLMHRLAGLENSFSEEYFVLVQLKTFQFMAKEISQMYKIDFESLKGIFELIIKDEENHREILTSLEDFLRKEPSKDTTPVVRYQHPEAW